MCHFGHFPSLYGHFVSIFVHFQQFVEILSLFGHFHLFVIMLCLVFLAYTFGFLFICGHVVLFLFNARFNLFVVILCLFLTILCGNFLSIFSHFPSVCDYFVSLWSLTLISYSTEALALAPLTSQACSVNPSIQTHNKTDH